MAVTLLFETKQTNLWQRTLQSERERAKYLRTTTSSLVETVAFSFLTKIMLMRIIYSVTYGNPSASSLRCTTVSLMRVSASILVCLHSLLRLSSARIQLSQWFTMFTLKIAARVSCAAHGKIWRNSLHGIVRWNY